MSEIEGAQIRIDWDKERKLVIVSLINEEGVGSSAGMSLKEAEKFAYSLAGWCRNIKAIEDIAEFVESLKAKKAEREAVEEAEKIVKEKPNIEGLEGMDFGKPVEEDD